MSGRAGRLVSAEQVAGCGADIRLGERSVEDAVEFQGVEASEVFHFEEGGQAAGPDPSRQSYNSFLSFADPDGNGWLVQEVRPGEASR